LIWPGSVTLAIRFAQFITFESAYFDTPLSARTLLENRLEKADGSVCRVSWMPRVRKSRTGPEYGRSPLTSSAVPLMWRFQSPLIACNLQWRGVYVTAVTSPCRPWLNFPGR
jgi:hypothetical protein